MRCLDRFGVGVAFSLNAFGVSLATLMWLTGCHGPSRLIGPTDWETLLTLPGQPVFQLVASPDSFLFAGGPGFLMRSHASDPTKWERIAEPSEAITQLYAPSGGVAYALTQSCGLVFRWDTDRGWHETPTPVRDSVWREEDHIQCIQLHQVWGRSARDVFVAGSAATVLHFDGDRWELVPTPYTARRERFNIRFLGLSGNDTDVVASGARVLRYHDGAWVEIALPTAPVQCETVAAAMTDGDALFGYNSCLLRLRANTWSVFRSTVEAFRGSIYDARTQTDGTALFWSYIGDVAAVQDDVLRTYHFDPFRIFASAVTLGPHLYIAGLVGDNGIVARVPR